MIRRNKLGARTEPWSTLVSLGSERMDDRSRQSSVREVVGNAGA